MNSLEPHPDHEQNLRLPSQLPHSGPDTITILFAEHPEWLVRENLGKFRERLVQLINVVLRAEDEKIMAARTSTKEGWDFRQLFSDLTLGMNFLMSKKGKEGLTEYLQKHQVDKLLAIGKKVRFELLENRLKAYKEKNSLGSVKGISIALSKTIDIILPNDAKNVVQMNEIELYEKIFGQCDQILAFAETLGIDPRNHLENCRREGSSLPHIINQTGVLELKVFIEVFCHRFGIIPTETLFIDPDLFETFKAGVIYIEEIEEGNEKPFLRKKWEWKKEEEKAYKAACQERFPNCPTALQLLKRYLNDWKGLTSVDYQASEGQIQAPRDLLLMSFPVQSLPSHIPLEMEMDEIKSEDQNLNPSDLPFWKTDIDYFIDLPAATLETSVKNFHWVGCWQNQLKNRENPQKTAQWLNRISKTSGKVGLILATKLYFTLLSLEKDISKKNPKLQDLLSQDNTQAQKLRFETACFASEVFDQLTETLQTTVENQCEEYQQGSTPLLEEVKSYPAPSHISPFLASEFWHPSFYPKKGPFNEDTIIELLTTSPLDQVEHILDYTLKQCLEDQNEFWSIIFDHFCVQIPQPDMVRILEKKIPEEILINVIERALILFEIAHIEDKKKKILIHFDLPYQQLIDQEREEIRIPTIETSAHKVLPLLSEECKKKLYQHFLDQSDKNLSDNHAEHYRSPDCHLFTTGKRVEADFLPHLREICRQPGHGLTKIITRKAVKSTRAVQEQLLSQTLVPADAADVAVGLLAEQAKKKNDHDTTVKQLKPESWASKTKGFVPQPYAFLNRVLSTSPEFRTALSKRLQTMRDTPLSELNC